MNAAFVTTGGDNESPPLQNLQASIRLVAKYSINNAQLLCRSASQKQEEYRGTEAYCC